MARPGRTPRPSALEERLGNPGHRKKNEFEPKPDPISSLTPPAFLDAKAKAEWKRVAPRLRDLGLLTDLDRTALAGYCSSYSELLQAETALKKHGLTFKTPNGYVQVRPEVSIRKNARLMIIKFCEQFGMTPSSRGRMVVDAAQAKGGKAPTSKLEEILSS